MATEQNRPLVQAINPLQSTAAPDVQPGITLSPKRVFQLLMVISICLFVISYIGVVIIHPYTDARYITNDVGQIVKQFDLTVEGNMSSWYSGMILFASAVLLTLIASEKYARRDPYRWYWIILALVFFFLSLDEITFIHEGIGHGLSGSQATSFGILKPAWTVAGLIFTVVVGGVFIPFILHLPAQTRRRLIIAGALYLTGALVLEIVEGNLYDYFDAQSVIIITVNHLEDVLEMFGVALFIYTLLSYIGTYMNPLKLPIRK
ncbi:MAG: hypothetical protein IT324_04655 [Anaerolineae bacterium]|nr:hypothetical protein [Anaerolineae bacterium]